MTAPVIADTYGLLPIPAVTPALGEAAGDPALTKLASFLTACLLAYGQEAWTAVAPVAPSPASKIVNRTFCHDPDLVTFSEAYLPALFLWRPGTAMPPTNLAVGIRLRADTIRVLWVPPAASQENERKRLPIVNAIVDIIDASIERTRVPSWVDDGDTDPAAATRGSLFANRTGLWSISVARSQTVPVTIEVEDAPPRKYQALAVDIDTQERLVRGGWPANAGVYGTVTSPTSDTPSPIVTESFDFS